MKKISELIIASENKNKIVHVKNVLEPIGIKVKTVSDLGKIEENGSTYRENALIKAENVFSKFNTPVLADDSGFEIESLNGFPGTVSARFASACGSYEEAFRILNSCISLNSNASFTTVLVLMYKDNEKIVKKIFDGKLKGKFVFPGRGTNGFGYCPCFIPEGSDQTLAEMSDETRMKFNHRAIALNKLCDFLKSENN